VRSAACCCIAVRQSSADRQTLGLHSPVSFVLLRRRASEGEIEAYLNVLNEGMQEAN
jgi:hypothetical protein